MKIAETGGAGYIGSHTIIELYKAGHSVVVIDNLVNSSDESLRRVSKIIGQDIPFVKADVRDAVAMDKVFSENRFDACIHFRTALCHAQERREEPYFLVVGHSLWQSCRNPHYRKVP